MSMKKFVSLMFALTFVFVMACGKGHEAASKQAEGEDDEAGQTTTAAATNTGGAVATSTAPAAAVVAAPTVTSPASCGHVLRVLPTSASEAAALVDTCSGSRICRT